MLLENEKRDTYIPSFGLSLFKDNPLNDDTKADDLSRKILEVINEKKPQSLKQLVKIMQESINSEEEILKFVLDLQAEGAIKFENHPSRSMSLTSYLKTGQAVWYWATIMVEAITAALTIANSGTFYLWIYARNVLGVMFILFLPGYAFIKALFHSQISHETSSRGLAIIERIALSIGTSFAIVSVVGILLYYSPWGLDLITIMLSLIAFTSAFATFAVIREYQQKRTEPKE